MASLRSKYYDLFSHWYDGFVALHSRDRQGGLRKHMASLADLQSGNTVLDLCTGTGAQLAELHLRVAPDGRVLGVDFSRGMLRKALAKCEHLSGIELIRADVAVSRVRMPSTSCLGKQVASVCEKSFGC